MDDYSFIDLAGITGDERQNLVETLRNVNLGYFDSDFRNGIPISQQPEPQVEENPPQAGLNHGQNNHYPQMEENLAQRGGPAKQNGAMNDPQEASSNCEDGPSENPLLSGRKPQQKQFELNPCVSEFRPQGIQQCQNVAQMPQAANPWTSNPNGSAVSYADQVKGMNGNDPRAWKTSQAGPSCQGRQQRMKTANGRYSQRNQNGYNGQKSQNDTFFSPPSKQEKEAIKRAVYNFLNEHPVNSSVPYEARGIVNKACYCFVNSSVQALFAVNPFAALLSGLDKATKRCNLESLAPFWGALLHVWRAYNDRSKEGPVQDNSIIKYLHLFGSSEIRSNSQGDVSEFLTYFIMKLQEELRFIKFDDETAMDVCFRGAENSQGEEEGWQQVKVGRRSGRRQILSDCTCLLAKIFGGSVISMPGRVTEPFFALDIAIDNDDIRTLQDAIRNHFAEEIVADSNTTKKITFNRLPDTLILSMKSSVFGKDGRSMKTHKQLPITEWLHLESDWVSEELSKDIKARKLAYRLTAAIIHGGTNNDSGHYWCYTRRNDSDWNFLDDSILKSVGVQDVINYHMVGKRPVPHCLVFELQKEK